LFPNIFNEARFSKAESGLFHGTGPTVRFVFLVSNLKTELFRDEVVDIIEVFSLFSISISDISNSSSSISSETEVDPTPFS
jgi:hypothetical protein